MRRYRPSRASKTRGPSSHSRRSERDSRRPWMDLRANSVLTPPPASRVLRPFDRRQRFEVERDRGTIYRRKLRRIAHHGRHQATHRIAVRHISGLEDALDIPLRVVADSFRRDVWDPTVAAFRIGTAGKALTCDDAAEEVARAVALRAMARAIDQISAAIPRRRLERVGLKLLTVEKKKF